MRLFPMILLVASLILLFASGVNAQTGLVIKSVSHSSLPGRFGSDATATSTTVYVQGSNRRIEFSNASSGPTIGPTITIQRCDTRVVYTLLPNQREYMETRVPSEEERERVAKEHEQTQSAGPPNLIIETNVVDTGETKQAFGHTAHHYVKTEKQIPVPNLDQELTQTVEDMWYLDMPDVLNCFSPGRVHVTGWIGAGRGVENIRPEVRRSGPEPQGLLLSSTRTTQRVHVHQLGESEHPKSVTSREIVDLAEIPVSPSLFEVPPGFTKVTQFTGVYPNEKKAQ